jgi:hypothetical protein
MANGDVAERLHRPRLAALILAAAVIALLIRALK